MGKIGLILVASKKKMMTKDSLKSLNCYGKQDQLAQTEINYTWYQAQRRTNIPQWFLFLIKTKIKLV